MCDSKIRTSFDRPVMYDVIRFFSLNESNDGDAFTARVDVTMFETEIGTNSSHEGPLFY